ncbi:MAG TPA: histidine phosphatase family protein [Acidimicrobiales bacterium]|nr:histidine phosphatase family protein [Acidimicrobiales bacterium]
MTRLLLVRHAEQVRDGRFWQHACPGLTPRGRKQAAALAARLGAEEGNATVAAVMSSRAARAIETASAVASALGVTLSAPSCQLCEMHPGDAEGLTPAEMNERFGPTYASVPGAQHAPDWMPTGVAALQSLAERNDGQTVVAVTHTAVLVASFVAFGGRTLEDAAAVAPFRHTSITEWARGPVAGEWAVARKNDATHLD